MYEGFELGGPLSTNWRASGRAWLETLGLVGGALIVVKLLVLLLG